MNSQAHNIRQIAQDLYPHYDQLEPLGQGGMGDLFKGRKVGLDVPIVVKIIKTNLKGCLDERQEAEILKGLKHKYLPRIYDVIENKDGYLYTIMDYIPGENLKDYVKQNGAVDQKTAYRWAQQLCEVVAYLHEQTPAIIHSDIKPGNVMITPSGDICLIDFNTSLEYRAGLTAIGKTKGYAAPEQYTKPEQLIRSMQISAGLLSPADQNTVLISEDDNAADETVYLEQTANKQTGTVTKTPNLSGKSTLASRLFRSSLNSTAATSNSKESEYYGTLTKQTDVYAIGATLYFALTGQVPPHALEPAKPLSSFRYPISRAMVQIIDRAMEKKPQNRFCNAAEMGKAFREIHRLDKNFRRSRFLMVIGIFLEIILILGGIGLVSLGSTRLKQEQFNSYVQILNEAQLEKSKGNYETALELTQQAQLLIDVRMEAYTEEAAVHYSRGVNAVGQKEREAHFKSCISTVQEILQAELIGGTAEEWSKLYFVGAESCTELKNYTLAQSWYRSAILLAPTDSYYRGLIYAYTFNNQPDKAKEVLQEMQTNLPNADSQASAELIQAQLCCLEEDYSAAITHYENFFRLSNDEALLRRTYLEANNACNSAGVDFLSQGIIFLEEACQRVPSAWGIYKPLLANAYYRQSKYITGTEQQNLWHRALEAFAFISVEYLGAEDRLTMNEIRINLLLLDDAEDDLLVMKELYPKDYRIYKQFSYLHLSKFAESNSQEDLKKAEEAYQTAKTYYEESGINDPNMITFIYMWQQAIQGPA